MALRACTHNIHDWPNVRTWGVNRICRDGGSDVNDPTRTLAAAAPECEFAAYSITSSASASTEGGTLKPIALATFILIAR
jgi:hypothetical protein